MSDDKQPFVIGEPTNQLSLRYRSKYSEIYERAKELKDGQCLPIEFPDVKSAHRFINVCRASSRVGLEFAARRNGRTAYMYRRTEETS